MRGIRRSVLLLCLGTMGTPTRDIAARGADEVAAQAPPPGYPSPREAFEARRNWFPEPPAACVYRKRRPGTRRVAWAEIDLAVDGGADLVTVRLEPMVELQMAGLGYLSPEWSHGTWKGELVVGGSRWTLPVEDPLALHHLHVQALCRATRGDEIGLGVLEQLVIGPHAPSGFTAFNDGA